MLRRDQGDRAEFITLSLWESVDAIRAFAGDDIEAAVLYPEDEHYLLGGESTVTHYQVRSSTRSSPLRVRRGDIGLDIDGAHRSVSASFGVLRESRQQFYRRGGDPKSS
jgi:hypothetical protein